VQRVGERNRAAQVLERRVELAAPVAGRAGLL
jgi:hypothetical protein